MDEGKAPLALLHVLYGESVFFLAPHEDPDGLDLVIHHLRGEPGIGSQKECLIHDGISTGHFTENAE